MIFRSTLACFISLFGASLLAEPLPVREITVFKDGHALLVHEGNLPVSKDGTAAVSGIPAPVLGSFFPFTSEPGLHIARTRTAKVSMKKEFIPQTMMEMLQAAKGRDVQLRVRGSKEDRLVTGKLREASTQTPPGGASIITIESRDGLIALNAQDIVEVMLVGEPASSFEHEGTEDGYSISFSSENGTVPTEVAAGYAYIQRGIRWFPSYTLRYEGEEAILTLQATLINEIANLDNVTARLAVGVPKIEFEGFHDPMAPANFTASLSSFFPTGHATGGGVSRAMMSQVMLSNSIMTSGGEAENAPGPALPEDANAELYFFTIENLTLARGERAVIPISTQRVTPDDLFRLGVPFAPPQQSSDGHFYVRHDPDSPEGRQLADALAAPKVLRVLSFPNTATFPLTTAPVMVMDAEGRLLAQSMIRYTPIGSNAEIELNPALNIPANIEERQVASTPNALHFGGADYAQVTREGTVKLANRRDKPVTIRVRRDVLGKVTASAPEATVAGSSLSEIRSQLRETGMSIYRHDWPHWITSLNGFDRLEWEVELQPGEEKTLTGTWQYYWR